MFPQTPRGRIRGLGWPRISSGARSRLPGGDESSSSPPGISLAGLGGEERAVAAVEALGRGAGAQPGSISSKCSNTIGMSSDISRPWASQ